MRKTKDIDSIVKEEESSRKMNRIREGIVTDGQTAIVTPMHG
jgi:hypothetical protein